ncbi:4-(cytidine 5'-diphospho)-2-C-methyl-D-erythritol kinase [Sphingomonas sp.]|uniref:4-(cytidine 5'-diphospho)-2-C-methyl-D-erythritol kinase n=1 Tax=Sphingomonas sp. TaxID=28214 RepID=UPI003B00067D
MKTITEPAPAKINLALHLRRKRPDGYHDLETLFAFARDGDVLTVTEAAQDSLTITGPFAAALLSSPLQGTEPGAARSGEGPSDNLVTRARDAFRASFATPPVAITLEKNLPIASGIGGGSADAAATLRALARLQDIPVTDPRLHTIAAALGADAPACLLGRPSFATGRGDDLAPLPALGDLPLLLVNPRVPLSTAAMFAAWDGIDHGPLASEGTTLDRARAGHNDFTAPAIAAAPVVAEVLALLDGAPCCTLARLSGSGATCFGLFADDDARDSAAMAAREQGWWVLATRAI